MSNPDLPFAGCPECRTPLVSTLEVRQKEWWCGGCQVFHEYLHATALPPTDEVLAEYERQAAAYAEQRAQRAQATS